MERSIQPLCLDVYHCPSVLSIIYKTIYIWFTQWAPLFSDESNQPRRHLTKRKYLFMLLGRILRWKCLKSKWLVDAGCLWSGLITLFFNLKTDLSMEKLLVIPFHSFLYPAPRFTGIDDFLNGWIIWAHCRPLLLLPPPTRLALPERLSSLVPSIFSQNHHSHSGKSGHSRFLRIFGRSTGRKN